MRCVVLYRCDCLNSWTFFAGCLRNFTSSKILRILVWPNLDSSSFNLLEPRHVLPYWAENKVLRKANAWNNVKLESYPPLIAFYDTASVPLAFLRVIVIIKIIIIIIVMTILCLKWYVTSSSSIKHSLLIKCSIIIIVLVRLVFVGLFEKRLCIMLFWYVCKLISHLRKIKFLILSYMNDSLRDRRGLFLTRSPDKTELLYDHCL